MSFATVQTTLSCMEELVLLELQNTGCVAQATFTCDNYTSSKILYIFVGSRVIILIVHFVRNIVQILHEWQHNATIIQLCSKIV